MDVLRIFNEPTKVHMKPALITFLLAFFISNNLSAQEELKNSISLSIGHTWVQSGIQNGEPTSLVLPSWAFDYNRDISEHWLISFQNEIIVESFQYTPYEANTVTADRAFPLSTTLNVGYRVWDYLLIFAGGGAELAEEGNFAVIRFGGEFNYEITSRWELVSACSYDLKIDGYNSLSLGLGIARKF